MPSMLRRSLVIPGIAVVALALVAFRGAQAPASGQAAPAPIAATADERLAALEKGVAAQQARLGQLERAVAGVAAGVAKLAAAAEKARAGGFESAGPNPASRAALLDGIAELQAAVKAAQPAPKDATKPGSR